MTRQQTRTPAVLSIYCTLLYLCEKMNIRNTQKKLPKKGDIDRLGEQLWCLVGGLAKSVLGPGSRGQI